ncbi:hypothetical protein GBF35_10005 [Nonomuraea phyllanthi]|uniref:hypothetical protein n=1 Tax=Nonomuraea phyllanthi TaxID=2219224 RepID=UPI001292DBF8|nr:hypothetical protein [Nonomuraea phyllanthi]QFY06975.1 hypothetical protein GBF35_10005 [Nonomuraea phyllanthi]
MRRTLTRTLIAAALLAAAAGCGGTQDGTGVASVAAGSSAKPSASAAATADPQEQGRKFAQCMRDHGVPMEDPDPAKKGGGLATLGEGVDKAKVKDAITACRAYSPFADGKNVKPEDVDQLRAFAACMRDNGVDMPDPNPDGTFASGTARNFQRDSAKFQKAFEVCGKKFPRSGGAK